MNDFDTKDYFTDPSFVSDPHPFFDYHRSQCPVRRLDASQNVIAVTGYDEVIAVLRDTSSFSNIVAPIGPFPPLPFPVESDNIDAQIDAHREQFPMYEHLVTMDPPQHSRIRRLVSGLFTPRRLDENEHFMWDLSDRLIDQFHASGRFEALFGYGVPFALLTIADLLGVPEEHHDSFQQHLNAQKVGSTEGEALGSNPLEFLDEKFTAFLEDRRREPRPDALTILADAKYPDGEVPDVVELVRLATFLFGAGQDTTARLITSMLLQIAEKPELQKQLREDRGLIPPFIEEMLRMEGPVKSDFRLARKTTTVGDVEIPAGTVVMVSLPAANRDPARFANPHELQIDRENAREHIAFGRGVHSCPGGPLARVEARVTIERILDRMHDIRVSEAEHGPAGERDFRYEPTYILRGLTELHLEFTPVG
ncbi:cytochrome P450 [Rhodococcus sp. NPDC060086]|uniref:cytochrome P450 n=1 Tax=Rhodococcus sp. NPDC060086 TaxID=3347055 RepID=UPI0036510911